MASSCLCQRNPPAVPSRSGVSAPPKLAPYARQDAPLRRHCLEGLFKVQVWGPEVSNTQSRERERAAVDTVQIYKEVSSAYFDWLPSRGLLLQQHVKSGLSRGAQHHSTPDVRFSALLHNTSLFPCFSLSSEPMNRSVSQRMLSTEV